MTPHRKAACSRLMSSWCAVTDGTRSTVANARREELALTPNTFLTKSSPKLRWVMAVHSITCQTRQ